jgi:hypothetical protein
MSETEDQKAWRRDAAVLAEIGTHLGPANPKVRVGLPRELADRALAAWQRDDGEGALPAETADQWIMRSRAASLALLGLELSQQSLESDDDEVEADLSAHLVGAAIDASWDERPPGCTPAG